MGIINSKSVEHEGREFRVTYNALTSVVKVTSGELRVLKRVVWLPYQRVLFSVDKTTYNLKIQTLPVCKFSLHVGDTVLNRNLFPPLRRRSLAMFALTPVRYTALLFSWALS